MKAVVTGASGTVGSMLRAVLESEGISAVAWDRQRVPVNNPDAMLNGQRGNPWRVTQTNDFVYDQRMEEPRVKITPLNGRLPNLPG